MKQYLANPMVLMGVAALILAAVYSLYLKPVQNPVLTLSTTQSTSTPSPTPNPYADWKTYQSTKYKYSMKYPNYLDLYEDNTYYHYVELNTPHKGLPAPFSPFYISAITEKYLAKSPVSVNYMSSDWINEFFNMKVGDSKKDAGVTFKKLPDINMLGQNAAVIEVTATGSLQKRIYLKNNGYLYMIVNNTSSNDFDKFASSFKFLE